MNRDKFFFLPRLDDDMDFVPRPIEPPKDNSYFALVWRKLVSDHKASRLAAALTHRTIFSLVPVAILCIVIVRGVVDVDSAKDWMLYKLMPNAPVNWDSALAGSLVAAVLWVASKFGFEVYVTRFMPYAELYGSLALLPFFLFWLYMIWWIVLFGLEVTAFRQFRLAKKQRS